MPDTFSRRAALRFAATVPLALAASATGRGATARLFAPPSGGRRRALLVGVSQYQTGKPDPDDRWANLHCENDVYTLRAALKARFGFRDAEIVCLTRNTTHAAIKKAIQTLADGARPGDTIYFHYSGHGALRADGNKNPVSTLVPSDWREPDHPLGENHLPSPELLRLFAQMRRNMTPPGKAQPLGSIFLTFDSCHSGKIVRGDARLVYRGENPALAPPLPDPDRLTQGEGANVVASRGETAGGDALGTGFAALFACRYYQSATEMKDAAVQNRYGKTVHSPIGYFTYYLAQTLASPGADKYTYKDVYDLVWGRMSAAGVSDQSPDLRGDTGFRLLNGAAPPLPPTVAALWETGAAGRAPRLALQAGTLMGVTVGSTYALYRIGDNLADPATRPLASATVGEVALTEATLVPAKPLAGRAALRAAETGHRYGSSPVAVCVRDIRSHPQGAAIIGKLAEIAGREQGLLTLTDDPAASVYAVTRTEKFATQTRQLRDADGHDLARPGFAVEWLADHRLLATAPDSADGADAIAATLQTVLQTAARVNIIKSLAHGEEEARRGAGGATLLPQIGVHLALRLIPCHTKPVVVGGDTYITYVSDKVSAANRRGEYEDGEAFVVEVANFGTEIAFITLLDIVLDNTITLIYPPDARANYDPRIAPGEKRVLMVNGAKYVITLSAPFGSEQLKLIGNKEQIDYAPLFSTTRGERGPRDLSSPLARLFGALQDGKRGDGGNLPGDTSWCTATATLLVTPKRTGARGAGA